MQIKHTGSCEWGKKKNIPRHCQLKARGYCQDSGKEENSKHNAYIEISVNTQTTLDNPTPS